MNNLFIHLRSLSSYSLSESTLKISNLVDLAKKNDMPAIAITDNNNMFGVFEFSKECVKNNIQPIIGTSINLLAKRPLTSFYRPKTIPCTMNRFKQFGIKFLSQLFYMHIYSSSGWIS